MNPNVIYSESYFFTACFGAVIGTGLCLISLCRFEANSGKTRLHPMVGHDRWGAYSNGIGQFNDEFQFDDYWIWKFQQHKTTLYKNRINKTK